MKLSIEKKVTESFLPSKRHRKPRLRFYKHVFEVEVKEVPDKEFPIAMIVSDYQSVSDGKTCEELHNNSEYKLFKETLRLYNGKLYKPLRITYGAAISAVAFETVQDVERRISGLHDYFPESSDEFTDDSIIISSNINDIEEGLTERASYYLYFDGKFWERSGEPVYRVMTFGMGNNHGGTGFFVEYVNNDRKLLDDYFNALQKDQAIDYFKEVALSRGDTDSVERFDPMSKHIEVIMPETVRINSRQLFYVTFKIDARYVSGVYVNDVDEALKEAKEAFSNANLGSLTDIVAFEPVKVKNKAGDYVWEK